MWEIINSQLFCWVFSLKAWRYFLLLGWQEGEVTQCYWMLLIALWCRNTFTKRKPENGQELFVFD